MKVSDVMTSPAITIAAEARFKQAAELMVHAGVGALPVVDDDGMLLGIVTEADLLARAEFGGAHPERLDAARHFGHRRAGRKEGDSVRQAMTAKPVTAAPDEDLRVVARRMSELHRKHLPVVEGDALVGMLSTADVIRLFHRRDEDILLDAEATLALQSTSPEGHLASVSVQDGVITLDGTAHIPRDRVVLEGIMWRISGVVDVRDHTSAEVPDPDPGPVVHLR